MLLCLRAVSTFKTKFTIQYIHTIMHLYTDIYTYINTNTFIQYTLHYKNYTHLILRPKVGGNQVNPNLFQFLHKFY